MAEQTSMGRQGLVNFLFAGLPPRLWCPLLTHYTATGALDRARIAAHWAHLAPHVPGYLIPGTTGDGWEMSESETQELMEFAVEQTGVLGAHLLIGVLKTAPGAAREGVAGAMAALRRRSGCQDNMQALARLRVRGFVVCAPKGADLAQDQIHATLAAVLELGLPTAFYQLPQITQNEMAPEVIADLARRFPNFFMFKDSSGRDRVALAGVAGNVFLVRGAEGDYVRWLKEGGGPYDGLLLSTANCFPSQLARIVSDVQAGRLEQGRELSARLTSAVRAVFALVARLPQGNPFTNANKAVDHCMAHGREALRRAPPRLHAGVALPKEVLEATQQALGEHALLPERGYLE